MKSNLKLYMPCS